MRKSLILIFLLITQIAAAQVEMAENFRGEGKIYVVIAVILVILTGIFVMLFKLDKRTKRLEKELEEK